MRCQREPVAPTPTVTPVVTPTPTPTVTATPPLRLPAFDDATRACQKNLASHPAAFADKVRGKVQRCFDRLLKDLAAGKDTSRTVAACLKALDPNAPDSTYARVRADALAAIVKHCAGLQPSDLDAPCGGAAGTMAEWAECVLDKHHAAVETMIVSSYADTCALLGSVGLSDLFSACSGSP